MKQLIIIIILSVFFSACNKSDSVVSSSNPPPSTSTLHVISAGGTSFTPGNVDAKVGDTLKFVWSSGTHTTTSTSVPTGAAAWDSPLTSSNTTFIYIIAVKGTYNYQCTFHASMGMTGTITAN